MCISYLCTILNLHHILHIYNNIHHIFTLYIFYLYSVVGSHLLSSVITSAQLQAQALQQQRLAESLKILQQQEEEEAESVAERNKLSLQTNNASPLQDSLDENDLVEVVGGEGEVKLNGGNDNQQQEQDDVQAALNQQDDTTTDSTTATVTITTNANAEDNNNNHTNTNTSGPEVVTEQDENKAENNSELSRFYTDFVRFGFPPLIENIVDIDTLKSHISDLSLYTTTTSLYNQDNTTPSPVTVSNTTSNLTLTLPYKYPIYERHIFELIIRCIACIYNKKETVNMSEKVLYNVVFQYFADKVRYVCTVLYSVCIYLRMKCVHICSVLYAGVYINITSLVIILYIILIIPIYTVYIYILYYGSCIRT